jgi:hypothetical protein
LHGQEGYGGLYLEQKYFGDKITPQDTNQEEHERKQDIPHTYD